jgi:hypothetical protein
VEEVDPLAELVACVTAAASENLNSDFFAGYDVLCKIFSRM